MAVIIAQLPASDSTLDDEEARAASRRREHEALGLTIVATYVASYPGIRVATSDDGYVDPLSLGVVLIVPDGRSEELALAIILKFGCTCIWPTRAPA